MKFIFVESFEIPNWNGRTARITKSLSSSHTAIINLAEGLAIHGHDCFVVSITNKIMETTYNDVKYLNYENVTDDTSCDYIITTNYINDWTVLKKITQYKK